MSMSISLPAGTDNGPHYNSWPDAEITPFRSEKNTNWEGGWRVPIFVRWPGKIKPGGVFNDIASHQDWRIGFWPVMKTARPAVQLC